MNRSPKTALRAMQREMVRGLDAIRPEEFAAAYAWVTRVIADNPRSTIPSRRPVVRNRLAIALCARFDELDEQIPLGTLALLSGCGLLGDERLLVDARTDTLRIDAARDRGEARSHSLRAFAPQVIEHQYGWCLRVLLQSAWGADGSTFRRDLPLGQVLREVDERGLLGDLLWREANHVRNAAVHDERDWDYDVDRRRILIRHRGRDIDEYGMSELFRKLIDIASAPDALLTVMKCAQHRDMLAVLGPPFLEFWKTGDSHAVSAVAEPFARRLREANRRLLGLGWARVPPDG